MDAAGPIQDRGTNCQMKKCRTAYDLFATQMGSTGETFRYCSHAYNDIVVQLALSALATRAHGTPHEARLIPVHSSPGPPTVSHTHTRTLRFVSSGRMTHVRRYHVE